MVESTLLIYARFFESKLLANEAYHKVNIIPNFVLPYDAERGMIPLIKLQYVIEAQFSFFSFNLARIYDFQKCVCGGDGAGIFKNPDW